MWGICSLRSWTHGLMLVISPPFAVTRLKGGFANVDISLLLWQILLIDLRFCGSKGNGTVRVSM